MDRRRFDHLCQALARRGLLQLLTALPLLVASTSWRDDAAAGRRARLHEQRKKKKRKRPCAKAGEKPKKGKRCCKRLIKDGSGRCAGPCTPATCAPNACGSVPDGCGGTLSCSGCAGNTLCVAATCQPCDVCPSGCFFNTVQAAIAAASAGETIRICAGIYDSDLTIDQSLTLIGAGDGDGAGNTILHGPGATSVVHILGGSSVSLQGLRITGGASPTGAGIRNDGALSLTACTITGNVAGGPGGGIYNGSTLTLTGSSVSGNTAKFGGGIYTFGSLSTVTLDATSRVTGNEADAVNPDSGGGIFNQSGTVTLSSPANVTNNTPDNCGGVPVPLCVG